MKAVKKLFRRERSSELRLLVTGKIDLESLASIMKYVQFIYCIHTTDSQIHLLICIRTKGAQTAEQTAAIRTLLLVADRLIVQGRCLNWPNVILAPGDIESVERAYKNKNATPLDVPLTLDLFHEQVMGAPFDPAATQYQAPACALTEDVTVCLPPASTEVGKPSVKRDENGLYLGYVASTVRHRSQKVGVNKLQTVEDLLTYRFLRTTESKHAPACKSKADWDRLSSRDQQRVKAQQSGKTTGTTIDGDRYPYRHAALGLDFDDTGGLKQPEAHNAIVKVMKPYRCVIHQTISSTHDKPRYRVVICLSHDITPAEYSLLSRLIARDIEITSPLVVDPCSFKSRQLFYDPHFFHDAVPDRPIIANLHAPLFTPTDQFGANWRELEPYTSRAELRRHKSTLPQRSTDSVKKQKEDPRIIGPNCFSHNPSTREFWAVRTLFNRMYTVEDILHDSTLNPGIYEQYDGEFSNHGFLRWRHQDSETEPGVCLHGHPNDDNKTPVFFYSHHENHDPLGKQTLDAFALAAFFNSMTPEDYFLHLMPEQFEQAV